MNKKLFALLTSAALMAGFVPSVFADDTPTASIEIRPQAETVAEGGEALFDVYVVSESKINAVQFNFEVENGTPVEDVKQEHEDPEDEDSDLINVNYGFLFDDEAMVAMKLGDYGYTGKMTEQDKIDFPDNSDYQIVAYDNLTKTGKGAKPAEGGTRIGTLRVAPGAVDTDVVVKTTNVIILWDNDQNVDVVENDKASGSMKVVAKQDEPSSTPEEPSSKPEEPSSKPEEPSSKPAEPSSSSSKAEESSSSKKDASSSSKATNGANDNKNTGATATTAVALAAAAAAMVVISKKRK